METRYLVYTDEPFLIVGIVKTEEQALQMVKENHELCYKSITWIE